MSIRIKTYPYGPLGSNMYAVFSDTAFIVIDPGVSPSKVDTDLQLKAIFITHGHFDHFASLNEWISQYPSVPVYIHEEDTDCIGSSDSNLSRDFGISYEVNCEAKSLDEVKGTKVLDDLVFEYFHTPGHSKGSCCLSFTDDSHKLLFTGDMLFSGSIGRTDFPGSSVTDMRSSIELLKGLDGTYEVYPGHGPATILQREINTNPFFY